MSVRDELAEGNPDLLFLDEPFWDDAILGIASRCGLDVVLYDYEKCIDILMQQGMEFEDAIEHLDFNVTGAYVGPETPMFLHRVT